MKILKLSKHLSNNRGVTFIEMIVTTIIGAIILAGVAVFINTYSWTTKDMTALQILQQEGSVISEKFMRDVRKGIAIHDLTSGTPVVPGESVITDATHIRIIFKDSSIQEFKMDGNILSVGSGSNFKNVSARLANVDSTASSFSIMPFGEGVTLIFTLELNRSGETIQYTETIGSVRCKNVK